MAYDAFLKFQTVDGGTTDTIEIESFSWGVSHASAGVGVGAGAGRTNLSDLKITKVLDKSSPMLFEAAAAGRPFPSATLTISGGGARAPFDVFLKFENVAIDAMATLGNVHGDVFPTEEVSLSFQRWEINFQKAD